MPASLVQGRILSHLAVCVAFLLCLRTCFASHVESVAAKEMHIAAHRVNQNGHRNGDGNGDGNGNGNENIYGNRKIEDDDVKVNWHAVDSGSINERSVDTEDDQAGSAYSNWSEPKYVEAGSDETDAGATLDWGVSNYTRESYTGEETLDWADKSSLAQGNFERTAETEIVRALATDYFGIIRVNATSSSMNSERACRLPDTDFDALPDVFLDPALEPLLKKEEVQGGSWEQLYQLYVACGTMDIALVGRGCVWNVGDLLRNLYSQGSELMQMGAEPKLAYSL
jgi:hypothetical protein